MIGGMHTAPGLSLTLPSASPSSDPWESPRRTRPTSRKKVGSTPPLSERLNLNPPPFPAGPEREVGAIAGRLHALGGFCGRASSGVAPTELKADNFVVNIGRCGFGQHAALRVKATGAGLRRPQRKNRDTKSEPHLPRQGRVRAPSQS
jgi:hypothetical protein